MNLIMFVKRSYVPGLSFSWCLFCLSNSDVAIRELQENLLVVVDLHQQNSHKNNIIVQDCHANKTRALDARPWPVAVSV